MPAPTDPPISSVAPAAPTIEARYNDPASFASAAIDETAPTTAFDRETSERAGVGSETGAAAASGGGSPAIDERAGPGVGNLTPMPNGSAEQGTRGSLAGRNLEQQRAAGHAELPVDLQPPVREMLRGSGSDAQRGQGGTQQQQQHQPHDNDPGSDATGGPAAG